MNSETAKDIEQAAADWVLRLDRHGRSPDLMAELERWLSSDTRRRGAFLQAEAGWEMLGERRSHPSADESLTRRGFSRRWLLAGGGSIAAGLVAAGALILLPAARYTTTIGEIRRVPLTDGSVATVNTASSIDVAIGSRERDVRLDDGEAWFQVAKDKTRPFLVQAGRVRVRAVGTAFAVRRREDGADVLVSEGVVETWVTGAEGHVIRISAGQRAFVADNAAIILKPIEPSGVDRLLAWREGKIDFNGETLADAAAEFNRYNRRQITILDPKAAEARFYGLFWLADPESFAMAVHQTLRVPVSLDDPAHITVGTH